MNLLNPQQLDAVKHTEGPLLIFAGAGTGKTRVLVHRTAYLLQTKPINPWNILMVTFTNKAAEEMRERVNTLVPDGRDMVWIATFHSTCVRILRKYIDRIGYNRDFVIYDDDDKVALLRRCVKELNLDSDRFKPKPIGYSISLAKQDLIDVDTFETNFTDPFKRVHAKVYRLYQEQLQNNNALDFDDLLMKAVELFEKSPDVLEEYQDRWRYIMVDEYQDTNKAQYRLLYLLTQKNKNLCVVGDDDQSIYRWRGADIRNILDFERDYPNAHVVKLEQNYRSTKRILEVANQVISKNRQRKAKSLWTTNEEGEVLCYNTSYNEKDEAKFVIKEVMQLQGQGSYSLRDISIFYRTNAQSRVFEEELRRSNIPYRIIGGVRFYERKEIKDIIAYLRVLHNPGDAVSLLRIINTPQRGIGKVTIDRLVRGAQEKGCRIYELMETGEAEKILSTGPGKKVAEFASLLKKLKEMATKEPLSQITKEIIEKTGYMKALEAENTPEAEARLENLQELVSGIVDFEQAEEDVSLVTFLDQVALVTDMDNYDRTAEGITLMTCHLAKGLEYPVVFVVGLEEGLLPHASSFDDFEEMEEERRLCYVAMTRAKSKLYATNTYSRRIYGTERISDSSRFIRDIPEKLIERRTWAVAHQQKDSFDDSSFDSSFFQDDVPEIQNDSFGSDQGLYQVGMRVRHNVFGDGMVINTEGNGSNQKLTVRFSNQEIKKLAVKYSQLEII